MTQYKTVTITDVPSDQLSNLMLITENGDPKPTQVTASADGKGTYTITAYFPVDGQPANGGQQQGQAQAAKPQGAQQGQSQGNRQAANPPAGQQDDAQKPSAQGGSAAGTLRGFDANFDCSHLLDKAKAVGVNFICRYYSHSSGKNLSPSEARLITAAGMRIVVVWETNGDKYPFFSYQQGKTDGSAAADMAQTIGQPIDSAIYFAVDYDASPEEISANITAYFRGVRDGMSAKKPNGPTYSVGVYGSGLTCETLLKASLVDHSWLAMSSGYRDSKTFTGWNIKQSLSADPWGFGRTIDPDVGVNDASNSLGAFTVALGAAPGNF